MGASVCIQIQQLPFKIKVHIIIAGTMHSLVIIFFQDCQWFCLVIICSIFFGAKQVRAHADSMEYY